MQIEREVHGDHPWQDSNGATTGNGRSPCTEVRRYAVVALTNLTFGKVTVKSFLCAFPGFIPIMVAQLSSSPTESLLKATAHLFRNLAWKADKSSKQTLSDSNVVPVLMQAAMEVAKTSGTLVPGSDKKDPTLEVILSALWNLSSHSRKNKVCTTLIKVRIKTIFYTKILIRKVDLRSFFMSMTEGKYEIIFFVYM